MKNSIGKKLKMLRIKRDLTQVECGRLVGVSKGYIAQVECYDVIPSVEFAMKIDMALQADGDGLLNPVLKRAGFDRKILGKFLLNS